MFCCDKWNGTRSPQHFGLVAVYLTAQFWAPAIKLPRLDICNVRYRLHMSSVVIGVTDQILPDLILSLYRYSCMSCYGCMSSWSIHLPPICQNCTWFCLQTPAACSQRTQGPVSHNALGQFRQEIWTRRSTHSLAPKLARFVASNLQSSTRKLVICVAEIISLVNASVIST